MRRKGTRMCTQYCTLLAQWDAEGQGRSCLQEASGSFSKQSYVHLNPSLDVVSPRVLGKLLLLPSTCFLTSSSILPLLPCELRDISDTLQHSRRQTKPAQMAPGHSYRHTFCADLQQHLPREGQLSPKCSPELRASCTCLLKRAGLPPDRSAQLIFQQCFYCHSWGLSGSAYWSTAV